MNLLLHNYVSLENINKYYYYEDIPIPFVREEFLRYCLHNMKLYDYQRVMMKMFYTELINRNRTIYCGNIGNPKQERVKDEYRKFINENKYGRITVRNRQISIPRIQFTKSNGNNIKYAPRRFPNGVGK